MMSLTGQRARYIYTLSRNSQIYRHCALGIRALFSSTVVSFGLGHRPTHLKQREKLAKSESVRDNSLAHRFSISTLECPESAKGVFQGARQ